MARKGEEIELRSPSRLNTVIAGAVIGALAGVVAASLLHRRAVRQERDSTISASEGIKVGLLVFGLLRAIAALVDDD